MGIFTRKPGPGQITEEKFSDLLVEEELLSNENGITNALPIMFAKRRSLNQRLLASQLRRFVARNGSPAEIRKNFRFAPPARAFMKD